MPGDFGATVVTNARAFYTTRAAAGALGTRHSPRPPWGEWSQQNSGDSRRGNAKVCLEFYRTAFCRPCESRDHRVRTLVSEVVATFTGIMDPCFRRDDQVSWQTLGCLKFESANVRRRVTSAARGGVGVLGSAIAAEHPVEEETVNSNGGVLWKRPHPGPPAHAGEAVKARHSSSKTQGLQRRGAFASCARQF
jgi:hypothetical protein